MEKQKHYAYIMTNDSQTVLYTGATSDLHRRILQHRRAKETQFTGRYFVRQLVYYEEFGDRISAFRREQQIKGGSRRKKELLIVSINPRWQDLSHRFEKTLGGRRKIASSATASSQ